MIGKPYLNVDLSKNIFGVYRLDKARPMSLNFYEVGHSLSKDGQVVTGVVKQGEL